MSVSWKFVFNQYELCMFCDRYVCKELYTKITYSDSICLGCAKCNRIYLTAVYDNDDSENKKLIIEYKNFYSFFSPVEFKKNFFEVDTIYYNCRDCFYVHDRDDRKALISYGFIKREWFIDKTVNRSFFYHAFKRVGKTHRILDDWYWVYE